MDRELSGSRLGKLQLRYNAELFQHGRSGIRRRVLDSVFSEKKPFGTAIAPKYQGKAHPSNLAHIAPGKKVEVICPLGARLLKGLYL